MDEMNQYRERRQSQERASQALRATDTWIRILLAKNKALTGIEAFINALNITLLQAYWDVDETLLVNTYIESAYDPTAGFGELTIHHSEASREAGLPSPYVTLRVEDIKHTSVELGLQATFPAWFDSQCDETPTTPLQPLVLALMDRVSHDNWRLLHRDHADGLLTLVWQAIPYRVSIYVDLTRVPRRLPHDSAC